MAEHTPGPWCFQFTEENGECFVIANNLGGMVGAALPWPTEIEARDFRRVIANARLIAAAPELFTALKCAVAAWEKFYPLLPVSSEVEDAEFDEFNKARSAICKVLGLQPWDYHKHFSKATA